MKMIIVFLISCFLTMTAHGGSMSVVSLATFPVSEQSDVPVDSLIKVYSSTPGSGDFMFTLYDATDQAFVDGHSYVDISGVVFKPSTLLNPGARYIAQYSSLTNSKQRTTWAFTTSVPDTTPIGSLSIEDNAADVDIYTKIELHLDANLNSNDVLISLKNTATQETVDIDLVDSQSLVLISTVTPLVYDGSYTLSVSSSLVEFSKPLVINFSTASKSNQVVDSFHVPSESSGYTLFSLVPHATIKEQKDVRVTFGAPFPKGFVVSSDNIRVLDEQNNELPIAIISTLEWLKGEDNQKSIRSAVIQLDIDFFGQEGRLLKLAWGEPRTSSTIDGTTVDSTWLAVDDDEFSLSEGVREPNAYALFSSDWYGKSVIKSRVLPLKSHQEFSAYDAAFYAFGKTAINHVDPRVVENKLLPYKTSYAAWLFDRAMTLYQLAFRTGELKFLKSAHRASQFYKSKISDSGYFSLKPSNDMKYSYGESLVSNYILTGDPSIPSTIESMVPVWDTFTTFYNANTNFWTERHAAFQLKGYTTAYEITAKEEYKVKAESAFNDLRTMQIAPSSGVPKTGALMHTSSAHGESGGHFIASPWMSTLLVDAIERFSVHIDHVDVPNFIVDMAKYFQTPDVSLWEWTGYQGDESYIVPHYLAGDSLTAEQHGGGGGSDVEHTPDVSKLFSAAYYYSCNLGHCDESFIDTFALLRGTQNTYTFPYWMRLSAPNQGYTAYRLSPPRKFNWWFNTSANNDFLLGNTSNFHLRNRESSELNLTISQKVIGPAAYIPGAEYVVKLMLTNQSEIATKNIFIQTDLQQYSPAGLAEIVSISNDGFDRSGSVVWKVDSLLAGESTAELEFRFKINEFPVLLTENRQLDDIIIKSRFRYCLDSSTEPECVVGTKNWDLGIQDFEGFSEWQSISVARPDTPPMIEVVALSENAQVSGILTLSPTITDEQGVSKVQFWLDGELLEETSELPYTVSFDADKLSNELHQLKVYAWDKIGSKASKYINFYAANPDVAPPSINILTPNASDAICDYAHVTYEAIDSAGIDSCFLSVNGGESVISQTCSAFTVPARYPLFSAQGFLSFNDASNPFISMNERSLNGTANLVSSIEGKYSQGILFSQEESVVSFESHDIDISNDLSVAFWINPSQDEGVIVSQDWYYIGNEYGWAISLGPNNHKSNNSMAITWSSGDYAHNANERNIVQTEPNAVALNQWQHVVVTKKNTLVSIYIDGQLSAQRDISYAEIAWPYTSKKALHLGKAMKHTLNYDQGFIGGLDEFAIWDRTLSSQEIDLLYQNNAEGNQVTFSLTAKDKANNSASESVGVTLKSCHH